MLSFVLNYSYIKINTLSAIKSQQIPSMVRIFSGDEIDIVTRSRYYLNEKRNPKFGFTKKAETINGRIAMISMSFVIANEIFTGRSILEQIGIYDKTLQTYFVIAMFIGMFGFSAAKIANRFKDQL